MTDTDLHESESLVAKSGNSAPDVRADAELAWTPLDDPERRAEMQERYARETAEQISAALADTEPPLSPEAVLESWKFACVGWRERAEKAEAALALLSKAYATVAKAAEYVWRNQNTPHVLKQHLREALDIGKSEGPGEKAGTEARSVGLHQPHPVQEKPGTGLPLSAKPARIDSPTIADAASETVWLGRRSSEHPWIVLTEEVAARPTQWEVREVSVPRSEAAWARLEAERDDLRGTLEDQIEMDAQSAQTLRDLHKNWEDMIEDKDDDGIEPLITNILYWLIEDVDPTTARAVLARIDSSTVDRAEEETLGGS